MIIRPDRDADPLDRISPVAHRLISIGPVAHGANRYERHQTFLSGRRVVKQELPALAEQAANARQRAAGFVPDAHPSVILIRRNVTGAG